MTFFRISQGKVASDWYDSIQVRWANVQAVDAKFSQDLTHQKSLKSVNFWHSYLKNKMVDVFWDTVYAENSWSFDFPLVALAMVVYISVTVVGVYASCVSTICVLYWV